MVEDQQDRTAADVPSEMERLLAEGERSLETEGSLDGDEAYRQRCERRGQRRRE